jgi:inhibitor of KinA sporulation pathway (predicted exonuclease)
MTQIICDEEGKLKQHQYISGLSEEMNESLVGNLIIKSQDKSIIDNFNKYGVLTYSTRR